MSKFKVGDKVALKSSPYVKFGVIDSNIFGYYLIDIGNDNYKMVEEDDIMLIEELPDMSDEEIYDMLKPKLDNSVFNGCIKFNLPVIMGFDGMEKVRCYRENEVIKAIALAYRSGYLRAKKGRPFKIGGEKE